MKFEEDHLNKDTNYEFIIEELNKSYNSYIKNKEALIETGTIGITATTIGLVTLSGFGWVGGVPLVVVSVLFVGKTKEAYKKELLQALSIGELGNIAEVEKYYKQLPKDLREKWANDNAFAKLSDYLKIEFSENRTYNIDEVIPSDDIKDNWVVVSGDGEINIV